MSNFAPEISTRFRMKIAIFENINHMALTIYLIGVAIVALWTLIEFLRNKECFQWKYFFIAIILAALSWLSVGILIGTYIKEYIKNRKDNQK